MLHSYIEAGLPILRGDVLRPRERGFLAAVLRPGFRAISVGVDVISGASGLIWPGDQVDVILVQDLDSGKTGVDRRVVGETILSDIRVIAVDQQFTQGAPAGNADGKVARTVALEVSAADAEKVAVAGGLGRIELSVRAIDAGTSDIRRPPLFGSDVSNAFARQVAAPTRTMRLIQGAETQEVTFR
jgi:pilus assembly protein CpaB